jgi:hypothetical protein
MGTSTSWIAVEGESLEQVAQALRLIPAPSDWTNAGREDSYLAAMLPAGWVLLVRRLEGDGVVADHEILKKLSAGRRVVGCDEESHVMYSASSEWREGREVWAVIHSSEKAREHLATRGDLPQGWSATRDESLAEQAKAAESGQDVDFVYEIPPAVAKLIVGYRLDSEDDDALDYVTLLGGPPTPSTRSSKPW